MYSFSESKSDSVLTTVNLLSNDSNTFFWLGTEEVVDSKSVVILTLQLRQKRIIIKSVKKVHFNNENQIFLFQNPQSMLNGKS